MGFGQWNGAPASRSSYRSLTGDMTSSLRRRRHIPSQRRSRRQGRPQSAVHGSAHVDGKVARLADFYRRA